MNNRRLSYGLLLTLASALVVGCGEPANPDTPPQPTSAPTEVPTAPPAATTAEPAPTTAPTAAPTGTAAVDVPPPAKPGSAKFVGKFVQDFSGEVKATAEADLKKKFAKEKDTKKLDEAMKKAAEGVAVNTIENTADLHTFSVKGKPVHSIHYTIGKDDPTNLVIKLGKDDTAKKDLKGAELAITFSDDNTFSAKDPFAKDPKKAATLVFKRQ